MFASMPVRRDEALSHREGVWLWPVMIEPAPFCGWDAVLVREGAQFNDECEARLAEIIDRLRQESDLSE
jgi:hypothetical protein